jgi:hypothetical protein
MNALSDKLGLSFLAEPSLFQVLLIVLATVLANVVAHIMLRYLARIARMTTSHWDDALVNAAKRPELPSSMLCRTSALWASSSASPGS